MALYNAFPLNMANAASRPANQPRQGSGLRNTTRLLAGLLTAGSASAWAAGPSVDLEASVSQQFPNDQMRVQLVKESRGHTIETLNAQVIEAINQALEKARTAPTVKAYANGINTHQEWNKNGEPDGWEVRGSLVLEGTDTAAVAHLAGQLASTLQLDGVSYQLSTARRQAEENNLIQQAADAFRARAHATATAFGYKGYEIKQFRLDSNHRSDSDSIGAYAVLASRSIESDRQRPSVPGEGGDTTITLTVRGTIELR